MYRVIERQLISLEGKTQMCHASTLLRAEEDRMLAAWFGGSAEGAPDTGIWMAVREAGTFSSPWLIEATEEPHWNPVLFRYSEQVIGLCFKVGHKISQWWTMVVQSTDGGRTWTKSRELVPGDLGGRGPVKNKMIRLSDGSILAPASLETDVWTAFADRSVDEGGHWIRSKDICIPQSGYLPQQEITGSGIPVTEQSFAGRGVIQPSLWESAPGNVHMLLRSSEGRVFRSDSEDYGQSWCPAYATGLPNNNSGLDLVRMEDGRLVLACNPVAENWGRRSPISLLTSDDNGIHWDKLLDMETGQGEFSYPAVIAEGRRIHVTYTYKREAIAYWCLELDGFK